MKLKKLVAALLIASLAVVGFAACGDKAEDAASEAASAASEAVSEAEEAVEEEEAAPAEEEAPAEESAEEEAPAEESAAPADSAINYVDLGGAPIYIGISTGSAGTAWRDQGIRHMTEVLDEYVADGTIAGYKFQNNVTNGDANEQAQIIRNFIDDPQVNVIMVNPNDATALNEAMLDAEAAGKLVVSMDATVTAEGILNVTLDHYSYAYNPVTEMCEKLGGEGEVVEISGLDGHPAQQVRVQATDDALSNFPNITLSQSQPGGWDQTIAKQVMAQWLSAGIRPDGIIGDESEMFGVLQACEDADYIPKIMNGDATKAFFEEWKKLRDAGEDFEAIVAPNPPAIQATAIRIAVRMAQGRHLDESLLDGTTYYYSVHTTYDNDNFDEGWEQVKDFGDEESLDEWITNEEADAMFVD